MGESQSKKGKSLGLPNLARKNLLSRWQKRKCARQLFAVARHDERGDGIYSFVNGVRWTQTEDFRMWPFDPPLSDAGIEAARTTGQRMKDIAESSACQMHVIVSSPYFRCIQTAVEICTAFGPHARLLIDYSLGEIYGPSIMGATEPARPVRPLEHISSYCEKRGLSCQPKVIGHWPIWPENVRDARKRFGNMFLTYLQRGSVTRRNFMLIGHADCVAASLSLMPSQAEHSIENVDLGGLFWAKRLRKEPNLPTASRKRQNKKMASIVPVGSDDNAAVLDPDTSTQFSGNRTTNIGWEEQQHNEIMSSLDGQVLLPEDSDGWEVLTVNINLQQKVMPARSGAHSSNFSRRVSALAENGSFRRERIEKLLGDLSATPLGTPVGVKLANDLDRVDSQQTVPTILSISTFLFGASDVGDMSDIGSGFASPRSFCEVHRISTLTNLEGCPEYLGVGPGLFGLLTPRNSGRPSHDSLGEHQRQTLSEELTSALLTPLSHFPSLPHSLHPLLEPLDNIGWPPEKNSIQTVDEQCKNYRRSLANKAAKFCRNDSEGMLKKVDDQSDLVNCQTIASKPIMQVPTLIVRKSLSPTCSVAELGAGELPNIMNSSLLRRRQMLLCRSLCQVEASKKIEDPTTLDDQCKTYSASRADKAVIFNSKGSEGILEKCNDNRQGEGMDSLLLGSELATSVPPILYCNIVEQAAGDMTTSSLLRRRQKKLASLVNMRSPHSLRLISESDSA